MTNDISRNKGPFKKGVKDDISYFKMFARAKNYFIMGGMILGKGPILDFKKNK